jgi:acid phosphatase
MENHPYSQIINNPDASFINTISKFGATFNNSHGVSHPSQPNYFALFSGSTQGIGDDNDHSLTGDNLALALHRKGKNFIGYAEAASPRKHNPWESFKESKPYGKRFDQFPVNFENLPKVSFVIPNLENDMHNGSIKQADEWLRKNLRNYVRYCGTHRSLFIMTFDEDDYQSDNRIFTVVYGSMVRPRHYGQNITHYSVLRTIEDIEGIPPLGESANVDAIKDIWTERGSTR